MKKDSTLASNIITILLCLAALQGGENGAMIKIVCVLAWIHIVLIFLIAVSFIAFDEVAAAVIDEAAKREERPMLSKVAPAAALLAVFGSLAATGFIITSVAYFFCCVVIIFIYKNAEEFN